jgi:hypothetical protein
MQMIRKWFPLNINRNERIARVVIGGVLIVASYLGYIGINAEFYSTFIGALGVVSGLSGHCPIFDMFRIKTSK